MSFNSVKLTATLLCIGVFLQGCDMFGSDNGSAGSSGLGNVITAPAISVTIQSDHLKLIKSSAASTLLNQASASAASDSDYESMKDIYSANVKAYNKMGIALSGQSPSSETNSIEEWNVGTTYATAGTQVTYNYEDKYGVFVNAWWTKGDTPSFSSGSGPWKIVKRTSSSGDVLTVADVIDTWNMDSVYVGGSLVSGSTGECYEAKYWTKGNDPEEAVTYDWETPWQDGGGKCDSTDDAEYSVDGIAPPGGGKPSIEQPEPCDEENGCAIGTPVISPVIPEPESEPDVAPVAIVPIEDFPSDGYEFLREVTSEHWNWLFPLRSGLYNDNGGTRNKPPIAQKNGSTDTFSLANFVKAVFAYNSWAKANNYKQFLNEGTKKQQAQEFIVFWAKSSRETSGSWSTASTPWVESNAAYGGDIWKGGLYWVEEVGYSTDSEGRSAAINYVDYGSSYTPVANRSYYGRGVIQLSWNYNYGAFSAWLYDNGILSDTITARDTLLKRPDYIATKGDLSIMSGIWFWMTPQGAKPSSHDVMHGNVYNVSKSAKDRGLPQRNDGGNISAASGDSTNQAVMAYRLGTVINIVNGGLECNKAAKWHPGPMQRISYFNAYTKYFNDEMPGLKATTIDEATNVWNDKVSADSHDHLKMASCYAQKSYYGW